MQAIVDFFLKRHVGTVGHSDTDALVAGNQFLNQGNHFGNGFLLGTSFGDWKVNAIRISRNYRFDVQNRANQSSHSTDPTASPQVFQAGNVEKGPAILDGLFEEGHRLIKGLAAVDHLFGVHGKQTAANSNILGVDDVHFDVGGFSSHVGEDAKRG